MQIEPFYDRGDLVAITVQTVLHNMFFGIALIFLIQWVFLGDLRCALIVAATIPVALFLAVIITVLRGESANLLSIGAIDLGIIVDATVIMVENIFRHLAHDHPARDGETPMTRLHRTSSIASCTAAVEVDKPIFFSVIITIAAFLPLFTMQGVEGQIFGPMARTYAYALIGAVIATFTVTPVLSSILLPEKVKEVETFLVRQISQGLSDVLLPLAVRRYRVAAVIGLAFSRSAACSARGSAPSSCPSWRRAISGSARCCRRPSRSKPAWTAVARIRNIITSYAPVRTVLSEQGRGDDGTDPDGSFVAEFFVPLKPFDEWPKGMTKEELVRQMSEQLNREFVGVDFNFSQYIQDNIEEAVSGVKGENSVKIFGRDLAELERLSKALKTEIGDRAGRDRSRRLQPARPAQPRGPDRPRQGGALRLLGRRHQRGGAGGDRRPGGHPGLRRRDEFRADGALRARNIAAASTPSARSRWRCRTPIPRRRPPISRSATSARSSSRPAPPTSTARTTSVSSRSSTACAAAISARPSPRRRRVIAKKVPLPPGYRMEWTGEFGALVEAQKRLAIIVPLSLLLILMLLYSLFNSIRDSLLALSGIPFAVAGGILGLYVAGLNFSVSAAVGFISLFGVSAMDGILLVSYIRRNMDEGLASARARSSTPARPACGRSS